MIRSENIGRVCCGCGDPIQRDGCYCGHAFPMTDDAVRRGCAPDPDGEHVWIDTVGEDGIPVDGSGRRVRLETQYEVAVSIDRGDVR